MKTVRDLLAAHPFFTGLDPAYLEYLAGCAKNVHLEMDQYFGKEGEAADSFYLIRSGRVAIELFAPGRGTVVLQTLKEGDILGWSWLFPPYKWIFGAKALEPTRATALGGKCLRDKCDSDPRMGYELMKRFAKILTERLERTRLQLLDVYCPTKVG